MPLPVDPHSGLPIAPSVPPGWSLSVDGVPVDPTGMLHPELLADGSGTAISSAFPLASVAAGGAAGWFLGKDKGKGQLWGAIGAAAGFLLKPLG